MLKNTLMVCLTLLLSTSAHAADYFVKNGGSDAADGLSDGNAWETISKVNGESFSAGDTVSFNKGDTWSERLVFPSSGASGNHITVQSYGSGVRPIIQSDTSLTTSLFSENDGYVTYKDIHFIGRKATDSGKTINFQNCIGPIYVDNIICDNVLGLDTMCIRFLNCDAFQLTNSEIIGAMQGIAVASSGVAGSGDSSGLIDNNFIHNQAYGDFEDWDGIKCSAVISAVAVFDGLIISNNEFTDWGEDGIDMNGCSGDVIVENNFFYSPNDIYTSSPNVNAIKLPNESEIGVQTVRNNIFVDIVTANDVGVCISGGKDQAPLVYNNICTGYYAQGIVANSWNGGEVYNNTISDGALGSSADAFIAQDTLANGCTVTLKNNILDGLDKEIGVDGASTVVTGDNNILVNESSVRITNNGTYNAGGSDQFATDPLFLTNSKFITTGSPAKNAGATITLFNTDIRGATRDDGTYDIGAYEFKTFLGLRGTLTLDGDLTL